MKKNLIIALAIFILLSGIISAQTAKKETAAKPIPATKIIPSPNSTPATDTQQEPKMKVGMKVPDFSVPALDKAGVVYSNADFKGKVYLIDFWATWCGPCVGEMKVLHDAYEKFHSKGIEFISFSADTKREDVTKFRKDKFPMPWNHVFVGRGKDCELPKVKEAFDVRFIPSPFLIDKDGNIVAMGEDLRGEKLEQTLAKFVK